jgi:hypothetical protein
MMQMVRPADFTRSDEGYYLRILRASSGAHMPLKVRGNCVDCWDLPVGNSLERPETLDCAAFCHFGGCGELL